MEIILFLKMIKIYFKKDFENVLLKETSIYNIYMRVKNLMRLILIIPTSLMIQSIFKKYYKILNRQCLMNRKS